MKTLRIIILVGTPGSGKTWVGETLARRMGLVFLDLERMLLARHGDTKSFLADKPAALAWFEERVRERAAAGDRTLIFEVGAFSQRDTMRRLREEFGAILVLVEAPADLRRRRIEERERGRHLTEGAADAMRWDDVFERELRPTFDFAFRVENVDLDGETLERLVREQLRELGLAVLPGAG